MIVQCNDGIDNDCDGKVDLNGDGFNPPDDGCQNDTTDNNEMDFNKKQCNDGFDNDNDLGIDSGDGNCTSPSDNSEFY